VVQTYRGFNNFLLPDLSLQFQVRGRLYVLRMSEHTFCHILHSICYHVLNARRRHIIFRHLCVISKKAFTSSCLLLHLSVCPSVRMYQRISKRMDFSGIRYWGLLRRSVVKIQILVKI